MLPESIFSIYAPPRLLGAPPKDHLAIISRLASRHHSRRVKLIPTEPARRLFCSSSSGLGLFSSSTYCEEFLPRVEGWCAFLTHSITAAGLASSNGRWITSAAPIHGTRPNIPSCINHHGPVGHFSEAHHGNQEHINKKRISHCRRCIKES